MEQTEEFVVFNLADQVAIEGVPNPDIVQIHSVAKDVGGRLYLSDEFNHRIVVLDSEGKYVRTIGKPGNGTGEFWYPRGLTIVEFEGAELLVVCDAWNHRIQKFDLDGALIDAFGSIGDGKDQFNEPVAMIPGDEGRIWILDRCNHRIKLCSLNGDFSSSFGVRMTLESEEEINNQESRFLNNYPRLSNYGFLFPMAFAQLEDGSIVLADTNNRRLCHITQDGAEMRAIRLDVRNTSPYSYPGSITALHDGLCIVGLINGKVLCVDVYRPWRITELSFKKAEPVAGNVITRINDGNYDLLVSNGKQIWRYNTSSPFEKNGHPIDAVPSIPPDQKTLSEIPNSWTDIDGENWSLSFTQAEDNDHKMKRACDFLEACKLSVMSVASKIIELEGEICKTIAYTWETFDKTSDNSPENRPRLALEFNLTITKRNTYRAALLKDIARSIVLLNGDFGRKRLATQRAEFSDLMVNEYNSRKKDLHGILNWVKEQFQEPKTMNFMAVSHAFAALVFLKDHIDYLEKTIISLDSSLGVEKYEQKDFMILFMLPACPYMLFAVAGNNLFTIGSIFWQWGRYDQCKFIYEQGLLRHRESEFDYEIALFDLLELVGGSREDMAERLNSASNYLRTYENTLNLINKLQSFGKLSKASEIIDKQSKEANSCKQGEVLLAEVTMRQKILTEAKRRTVTLPTGQSIESVIDSGDIPDSVKELTYLKSVSFVDPEDQNTIIPRKVIAISKTKFLVVGGYGGLFLYEENSGLSIVWKQPNFQILEMDMISPDEALLVVYKSFPFNYSGLLILDVKSGEIDDITHKIKCQLPYSPSLFTSTGNGEYLFAGVREQDSSSSLFLVDTDFSNSEPIETGLYGNVGGICTMGDELILSYPFTHTICSYNLTTMAETILTDRLWFPTSISADSKGVLFVVNGFDQRGMGISVYGSFNKLLCRICAVESDVRRRIFFGRLSMGFQSANMSLPLIMADHYSLKAHIFNYS